MSLQKLLSIRTIILILSEHAHNTHRRIVILRLKLRRLLSILLKNKMAPMRPNLNLIKSIYLWCKKHEVENHMLGCL
jgi:hypothetical protein